jgi:hypothetical protein
LVVKLITCAAPAPAASKSTATKGASSTRMPTFSTGVTRKNCPSSRFRIVENSRTSGFRPIGVPS